MSTASQAATSCDLLVIGSGAGGLSAAVTAASLGLRVIVVEKERVIGGTTAWSGGWLWIPRNPLAVEAGIREDIAVPRAYLRSELGEHYDRERIDAFLIHGPRMVEFFRARTALQFVDGNAIPDFHESSPGSAAGGRSVCAAPFDARALGSDLSLLREPLDLIAPWGMGIASGADLGHFLRASESWPSFAYVARRVIRHFKDLLLHRRGMHLVNGNALVARLMKSAIDVGVQIRVRTPAKRLLEVGGRITGAVVATQGGDVEIVASRGVVLACGGFPHDEARIRALFPHARAGGGHWSAAVPGDTGDGLRLGESVGGVVDANVVGGAGWAPVSLVARRDGTIGHFPHLIERAKPGLIAVSRYGRRFVNEAGSYYDFMSALFAALPPGEPVHAYLICDHTFIRRYGLGHVRPAPFPLRSALRSGYLKCGSTPEALARACGIDARTLQTTLERYNADAREGRDAQFGRGSTRYNRSGGDATQHPNPCVAPIAAAPFYAVQVVPGSLGTFAGLATDASARVLDGNKRVIAGLYACGNDMASIMGGYYPSGGITLGPALTFGYIIGRHAAGVALDSDSSSSLDKAPAPEVIAQ